MIADGMLWPIAGVGLGLAGALAATQLLSHLLFDVTAFDPVTFAAVAVILPLTALVTRLGPARRAARIDVVTALRVE